MTQSPIVMAFWVLHAHAHDAVDISPILAFTSPEKRGGVCDGSKAVNEHVRLARELEQLLD